MSDPPSGTITFLFTDIEGSTKLWERSPAAMGPALARHNTLLREAIEQRDGYVFKTIGDAFCAAFPTASAALTAAYDAQLGLTQEPWSDSARITVRMALHTGTAEVVENDYFGQPLNRVARLLAAGHGGQVLLSLATQELLRDSLPAGVALRDMGERRLKDLIRPERVYQMVAPQLPADFPPLRTLDARAHNLPIQSTSFVGRDREMHDIETLLHSSRLVTLTGSGGAGKTRLALQVGADRIDDYADGVWLVELAPLTDARLVPQAVATVLGVKEQPGQMLTDSLAQELKYKELLLLLDNCEHVVEASAKLCQLLLSSCAKVRILSSSREVLRVAGEVAYQVPSLATPDPKATACVESLTQYAAVQLFIDRALAARPSFRVDNANAPAVASICYHLGGIPLAIELAAARMRLLSVEEVNERLDQRFRLLTGGARTALPRQQTLRALIDWSYDLLQPAEQALFCRLAVFAGGWTLHAAERVCGDDGGDEQSVLDLLASLVDKSLVLAFERNGVTRYRLLETVRQYARDRLREISDETRCQQRHLAHFLAVAEVAEPKLSGGALQEWLDQLETEHDNVRSALAWSSAAGGDAAGGLRLAGALIRYWSVRGHLHEGRGWLSALLAAAPDGQTAARAKALNGAAALALHQGDFPAVRAPAEDSLALWRELGNRRGIARSLQMLAAVTSDLGDIRSARALHEESLAIWRELGDRQGVAASLSAMGVMARAEGDLPTARALLQECLPVFRELNHPVSIALSLHNLGNVACDQGEYPAARRLYEESLAIRRELRDRQGIASTLSALGDVALVQSDHAAARALFEEGLAVFRELNHRRHVAYSLGRLGTVACDQGEYSAARTLHEESLGIFRDLGHRQGIAESLADIADLAFAQAVPGKAARLWGAAERMREQVALPLAPSERARYDRQIAAARAAFGDDADFERAWREGRAMTMERAIEFALQAHVAGG